MNAFIPEAAPVETFKGQALISIETPIVFEYDGMSDVTGHLTEGNPIYTGDRDWEGIHVWEVEYNGSVYYALPALVTRVRSDNPIEVMSKVSYHRSLNGETLVKENQGWNKVIRTVIGPSGVALFECVGNYYIRVSDALALRNE